MRLSERGACKPEQRRSTTSLEPCMFCLCQAVPEIPELLGTLLCHLIHIAGPIASRTIVSFVRIPNLSNSISTVLSFNLDSPFTQQAWDEIADEEK